MEPEWQSSKSSPQQLPKRHTRAETQLSKVPGTGDERWGVGRRAQVDKEGANVEKVKQELAEAGLLPEEWGGTAQVVPISAKTGQGVDQLLETVLLVAEVEQLMANPDKNAVGTVIEAHLDRRTGPVASLLVAAGTLRPGDVVVAGTAYGKVPLPPLSLTLARVTSCLRL